MTLDELLAVAEIVEKLTNRYRDQEAAHKAALTEIRASFNARTSADEKRHEGILDIYRSELDEIDAALNPAREESTALVAKRLVEERDALRAEVAALKSQTPNQHGRWVRATSEKCTHAKAGEVVSVRGYLVRTNSGEFLWEGKDCEPCDPPQTAPVPKRAHPVAVGGYLRRLTGFNTTPAGEVARVTLVDDDDPSQLEYEVVRPNGQKGRWSAKGCEPCDPPIVKREPTIGDTVRTVCLGTNVHVRWPMCCVEVVAEATHDTDAGKATAESGLLLNGGLDVRKVTT